MQLFGSSKKNDGKAAGGFGLPSLSFGKVDNALGKGIGQATNTLKNTGEKVDDFLFGHSNNKNGISVKNDGKASGGFGLPSLSFGKVDNALGKGIGQATNTLKKTGEKVDDFLFGHAKNQNNKSEISVKNDGKAAGGFGLPSLSFGKVDTAIGKGIGQATNTLKNTGEKVDDFLFGHSKNQNNKNEISIGAPGFGISLNTGKLTTGSSHLTGTFNGIDQGLNKTGGQIEKAGEKTLDFLFGNKDKQKAGTGKLNLPNPKLPGLSLEGIGKTIDKDIGNVGHGVEKTGKKVVDFIFGKGNKTQAVPGLSLGGKDLDLTIGGDLSHTEKNTKPSFTDVSSGGTNLLGGNDIGHKVDSKLKQIGSGVGKTGEKVVDFLFGGKTTKIPSVSASADIANSPGGIYVTKKVHDGLGKIQTGLENTGAKVTDYLFGGKSKTTSQPGFELGGNVEGNDLKQKLPDQSGSIASSQKPNNSPGAIAISKKIQEDRPELGSGVTKTGEKVIDTLFGGSKGQSSNASNEAVGTANSISSFTLSATTPLSVSSSLQQNQFSTIVEETSSTPIKISNLGINAKPNIQANGSRLEDTTVNTSNEEINSSSDTYTENTTTNDLFVSSAIPNIHSYITSSEESTDKDFGVSEMPTNQSTKSEETLRKIEDILQGSGQITTETSLKTDLNLGKKVEEVSENTNSNSHEVSTTVRQNKLIFDTPILEVSKKSTTPVEQNPFFLVSNNTKATGEQFTPQLPPSVFDKPTGGKAPFIPILPPPMESTVRNIITPLPTSNSQTLSPPITSAPSRSLTPVEYGAIGLGGVFIFALLAYIYQKYRQYRTSSSGGSYSPKANHRNTAGRKRSTRSNDSEGGQPSDVQEADETLITQSTMNGMNSEVVVVEIAQDFQRTDEVVEMPVTKTVVNGLQKSSTGEIQAPSFASENCADSIETVSEKQKSAIEKPPRKTKTPTNSPEKFTSDKTSASQLNGISLKTVSHAIGGILRSQVPDREENEKQKSALNGSNSEKDEVSLGRRNNSLAPTSAPEIISEIGTQKEVNKDEEVREQSNASGPLYTSLDTEVDAGSEYYSADENSDSKNSPPLSPSLEHQFQNFKSKNLRAEDVYNTEIISEDGRRRSIEDDIAESIDRKLDTELSDTTYVTPTAEINDNIGKEALITSEAVPCAKVPSEDISLNRNDSGRLSEIETQQTESSREIDLQNSLNTEKNNIQQYKEKEAEEIVDDILRASLLDPRTVQSIHQDLGNSPVFKPGVTWSDSIQFSDTIKVDLVKSEVGIDDNIKIEDEKPQITTNNSINTILAQLEQPTQTEVHNPNNEMKNDVEHVEPDNSKSEHVVDKGFENNIPSIIPTEEIKAEHSKHMEHSTNAMNLASNDTPSINNIEDRHDLIDEGFPEEHRFEFIPPKQPQIYEDDMIVFSNSDRGSISTLSTSTLDSNRQNDELLSTNNKKEEISATDSNYNICEECGGIQNEEMVAELNTVDSINIKETVDQQTRTKWYVPNDDITDLKKNEEEKLDEGFYIVLSENSVKPPLYTNSAASEILASSDGVFKASPGRSNRESKYSSNISYAYLEVTDDPMNEGWPGHLPKNIHSISGVGLIKTVGDVLKEEELEIPSTSGDTKCDNDINESSASSCANQKPIPKFIIPNMDARLSKKRSSRRRQIKSLDSGVHHYYGEYLNLVEFPDIEADDGGDKIEKVIEDVITIKPDGTITEEKIIIQNSK